MLTGDIHLAAVGTLPGVGVEFVTTSISSPGLVPPDVIDVLTGFPDIVDAEFAHRGYTRHTVTPEAWTAEYRIVDDVADPRSTVSTWKTFTVDVNSVTSSPEVCAVDPSGTCYLVTSWRTTMEPVRSTS